MKPPKQPFTHQPLHATDLEQAVLGAMLLESGGLLTGMELLKDEAIFYHLPHRLMFRGLQTLFSTGQPIDSILLAQHMREAGTLTKAGGPQAIVATTYRIQSAAHLPAHCLKLLELYVKRTVQGIGQALINKSFDATEDAHDLLAEAQGALGGLYDVMSIKRAKAVGELYDQVIDDIKAATRQPDGLTGVPSGLRDLDAVTGGWQPGDLIILAARPAMGKTSSALSFGRKATGFGPDGQAGRLVAASPCGHGYPGAFFSLEMPEKQLVLKLIGTEAGYSTNALRKGQLSGGADEAEHIRQKAAALRTLPFYIDDTPALAINELRAKAKKMKQELDIQWLTVDYLQLMTGNTKGTREQEISSISRGLKLIAKELNIPVIALSQLSRAVEARGGDKKPQLSDLRESGAIEQDADLIIFPFRPEYYGITEDEQGNPTADLTNFIIAKHRNGPLKEVLVQSKMKFGQYADLQWHTQPAAVPAPPGTVMPRSTFDDAQNGPTGHDDVPF